MLLSDEDHFGAILPCGHLFPKKQEGGALHSEEILKRSIFPLVGLIPPVPLPSLAFSRTHSARRGTYIPWHLETYRQMGKPALPSACFTGRDLMEAYPHSPRLRKDRNVPFFPSSTADNLQIKSVFFFCTTTCQVYSMVDFSGSIQQALFKALNL